MSKLSVKLLLVALLVSQLILFLEPAIAFACTGGAGSSCGG